MNYRRLRPISSPQSQKSAQNPKELQLDSNRQSPNPLKTATSFHSPERARSPPSRPGNEWPVSSPLPRSRTQGGIPTPVMEPPAIRKRRQHLQEEQHIVFKTQKPTICKEDTKTWENLTAKTCELADADVASESLNDLIMQLIEEQSISPTDTIMNESVISWKTLIASLTDETHSSANITKVQEVYDKYMADHTNKLIEDMRNYGKKPQICHSATQARQHLSDQEFESVVSFDASFADTALIEYDPDIATFPNHTSMADQVIDLGGQEASLSLDTQLAFSSLPPKDSTENTVTKGDRDETQAIMASLKNTETSATKVAGETGSSHDWGDSAKSNLIGCMKNQVVVGNAVLMMSCLGIIDPFGEGGRSPGPYDFALLPTYSDKTSSEESSESSEQDSVFEETLVSLNSVCENIQEEHVEALKQDKADINADRGVVDSRPQNGLFEKRTSTAENIQSSTDQSPKERQSDTAALPNSEVGRKQMAQNPNVEQVTLNEFPEVEDAPLSLDLDLENRRTNSASDNYSGAMDERLSIQLKVSNSFPYLFVLHNPIA